MIHPQPLTNECEYVSRCSPPDEFAHPYQRNGYVVALDRRIPYIQSTNPRTAPNKRVPLVSKADASHAVGSATKAGYRPRLTWPPTGLKPPLDCSRKHLQLCEYVEAVLHFGNDPHAVGRALDRPSSSSSSSSSTSSSAAATTNRTADDAAMLRHAHAAQRRAAPPAHR